MRVFVDSADADAVSAALRYGYVYGVTTNPTLLRRANIRADRLPDLVRQFVAGGAQEVHLQVYSADQEQMIQEARMLREIAPRQIVIKIPATPAGYAAATHLTQHGVRVTLTAVYTVRQALLAQSVGASYVAVYVGRMRDAGLDALATVAQMQAMLGAQQSSTHILAASIRDPLEIEALGSLGVGAATIAPPVLAQLLDSPLTDQAAATFGDDARAIR